jgi:hypothetical protein
MTIDTTFTFHHKRSARTLKAKTLPAGRDLLGPLRGFLGNGHRRTWRGRGLNLIWRPNFDREFGPMDFFLELNLTREIMAFKDVAGKTGIANRGSLQKSIFLGGLAYLQTVYDRFDNSLAVSGPSWCPRGLRLAPGTQHRFDWCAASYFHGACRRWVNSVDLPVTSDGSYSPDSRLQSSQNLLKPLGRQLSAQLTAPKWLY